MASPSHHRQHHRQTLASFSSREMREEIPGVFLIEHFVTKEEERKLIEENKKENENKDNDDDENNEEDIGKIAGISEG